MSKSPAYPQAKRLDGWETRFIGQEPRLSEVAQMYEQIGFEVKIEPFTTENCEDCCKPCFEDSAIPNMVVYTRRREVEGQEDDLF